MWQLSMTEDVGSRAANIFSGETAPSSVANLTDEEAEYAARLEYENMPRSSQLVES